MTTTILLRIPTTATAAAAAARGIRSFLISSSSSSSSCPATMTHSCKYSGGRTKNLTSRRHLSFSRMLDMGGAPSAMHDKSSSIKIQTSKNCKVQAICFDFEILTSSLDATNEASASSSAASTFSSDTASALIQPVKPDINMIQQVASLLNVKVEGVSGGVKKSIVDDDSSDEDLSLLTGERKKVKQARSSSSSSSSKNLGPLAPDIRQKYANKLFSRGVEGGVASVELAKHQVQETLKRGDAAGHLAARKMVAAEPVGSSSSSSKSSSGNRWMAQTGTGALLQYLSQRSLKLGLLPRPGLDGVNTIKQQGERMKNFQRQLPDVTFDVMMLDQKDGHDARSGSSTLDAQTTVANTLEQLKLQPELVLLVSDRDDYLKAAKEAGMVTCRLRVPNARRGNVSAHYMVSSIPEVQEVVNEINGISYKAVLKGR